MTAPRVAYLQSSAQINWSDGSPFDGYIAALLALPTGYAQINLDQSPSPLRIPTATKIAIIGGVIDLTSGVYFNSDIEPPGSKYVFYFVDATNTQVGVGSGLLTVNANPYIITVPTLTVPTSSVTVPVLET